MSNDIFKRYEIKYLVTKEQRKSIEEAMKDKMIPDAYGESTICNIYYDTPDKRLIRVSLESPAYKEKLRVRSYGQIKAGEKVYVELKKKYDGVVYKRRVAMKENRARIYLKRNSKLDEPIEERGFLENQILKELDYVKDFYKNLEPSVYLCYDRTAYFSKDDENFRVTFDKNIKWRNYDMKLTSEPDGRAILEDEMSLMEIKTATAIPMWFVSILSKEKINRTSFSKYGRAYMQMLEEEKEQRLSNGIKDDKKIIKYDFGNRKVG